MLAVGCAIAVPSVAQGAVSFTPTTYPLPVADTEYHDRTGAVSTVDLTGDGKLDIVIYRGGGNIGQVYVLLNLGGGSFAAPQTYSGCASSDDGGRMLAGQFDAGQAADVILGCDAATGLDRLLGNGDGTFGAATNYPSIGFNNPLALWPGDNGDFPAVLYTQSAGEFYMCYRVVNDLGNPVCPPDTSASDVNGPSGHAAVGHHLATGHFYSNATCNRDDVILSPYLRAVRAWGLNPFGTGAVPACTSFSYVERAVQGIPGTENLDHVSTGDLTGDGTPDLLMSTDGSSLVALPWLGGSDVGGGFPPGQQSVVTPTIAGIEDQQLADFDGDGRLDVALVGETSGATTATLAIQTGKGDASFDTPPTTFSVIGGSPDTFNSIGPNRIAVGDLNGDGKPDIASIAQHGDAVTVLLNGSSPPAAVTTPTPQPIPQAPPPSPSALDTTAPGLSNGRLTATKFAVAAGPTPLAATVRGTTIRYSASEAGRLAVAILRQQPGKRRGRRCVKPNRKLRRAKRCTRMISQGTLKRTAAPGPNSIRFTGRMGTKPLAVGNYTMTLIATDAAGNHSRGLSLAFRIVKP